MLLIPGTSSVKHLRENLHAAALHLLPETIAKLDAIAKARKAKKRIRDRNVLAVFQCASRFACLLDAEQR
jgi:diketogulonate reductase-like aldo/keto reductase